MKLFVIFQLNNQTIEITRFGLRLHLFMNSHELSCFFAFFCSLQNRWGRGIPYSENLFSIPVNSPLRNAEQLEDFVFVFFLMSFRWGVKLLKSGLPARWLGEELGTFRVHRSWVWFALANKASFQSSGGYKFET